MSKPIAALLLSMSLWHAPILAEPMSVSTLQLNLSDSYDLTRVYGGQLKHRRMSHMGFETSGVIGKVHVNEGDVVKTGEPLVTLDQAAITAQLEGAMAEVDTARAMVRAQQAQLQLSASTLKRNQELAINGHVSIQLLDELQQQQAIQQANLGVTETQLRTASARADQLAVSFNKTILKAPYDAQVQTRHLDEGSIVNPGVPAITVVEHGFLEATIGFPQKMIGNLVVGNSYEFTINDSQIPGRLKAILPNVDPVTGTITALFTIDADHLFGGALAELNLSVNVKEEGFWVPVSALAESQRGLWAVLVVTEDDVNATTTVETRLVEILYRGPNAVYVRGTLEDGDLIVDSGTGRIVPGQNVRVATRSANFLPAGS
ncbi:MAG: RND family efflux transporter MFP subunit [Candidatus Azotimanducaceae bacterium]|jgi:RND family efflux transporter MFP subunit